MNGKRIGVNDNGVQWVKLVDKVVCTYQFSSTHEVSKTYKTISDSRLKKLTINDIVKK